MANHNSSITFPFDLELIDCNVGLGPWPFHPLRYTTPRGLLQSLSKLNVRRIVATSNTAVFYLDPTEADAHLLRTSSRWSGQIAPVVTIDPMLPEWEGDLQRFVEQGAAGIRLLPRYHGYSLTSPAAREVVRAALQTGLPLFVPLRLGDERHQHSLCTVRPLATQEILEWLASVSDCPPIVFVNGRFDELRALGTELAGDARAHFDLSFVNGPDGAIEQLVDLVGSPRLLFGSWAPFQYPHPKVEQLAAADLPTEVKQAIGAANAKRLFFSSNDA